MHQRYARLGARDRHVEYALAQLVAVELTERVAHPAFRRSAVSKGEYQVRSFLTLHGFYRLEEDEFFGHVLKVAYGFCHFAAQLRVPFRKALYLVYLLFAECHHAYGLLQHALVFIVILLKVLLEQFQHFFGFYLIHAAVAAAGHEYIPESQPFVLGLRRGEGAHMRIEQLLRIGDERFRAAPVMAQQLFRVESLIAQSQRERGKFGFQHQRFRAVRLHHALFVLRHKVLYGRHLPFVAHYHALLGSEEHGQQIDRLQLACFVHDDHVEVVILFRTEEHACGGRREYEAFFQLQNGARILFEQ